MTEHGPKPHTLDQHINEPMSGKGKNEPPATVPPVAGAESTEEDAMGKVEKVAAKTKGGRKPGRKVASGPGKVRSTKKAVKKAPAAKKPEPPAIPAVPPEAVVPAVPVMPGEPAAPATDAPQSDET